MYMDRPESHSGGDYRREQLFHDSAGEENPLNNEEQLKQYVRLWQTRENPKSHNLQNQETGKWHSNYYAEYADRLQDHYGRLLAREHQYRKGFSSNECGDYPKNAYHDLNDGNISMSKMQGKILKNLKVPFPKDSLATNCLSNVVNKRNTEQLISTTHEILEDAFKRNNRLNERRPFAKDVNGSQFDTLSSNVLRLEGHAPLGGNVLPNHFALRGKTNLHKSNRRFNDIVENFQREESIGKRGSAINQSIGKDFAEQSLFPEHGGSEQVHLCNKIEHQDNSFKKEDLPRAGEALDDQVDEEYAMEEDETLKKISSIPDSLVRSNHSLKSYSSATSKLTLKSIKKLEESLELQKKKCSLINTIDRSISMIKMSKKGSTTKITPNHIDEKDQSSKYCIATPESDRKVQTSTEVRAINDVLHSEVLTNMFKDCRDYHLQNIQQEVKRILYLEKLPEKIKQSVK